MGQPKTLRIDGHLPTLYIPWPQCGHCFEDVDMDDGYAWCPRCLIQWSDIREELAAIPDEQIEGTEVPCEIVEGTQAQPHDDDRGNHYEPGPPLPCILPSGHEGAHLCPHDVIVTSRVLA